MTSKIQIFSRLRNLAKDTRGVYAVEFGLIAAPFCMIMLGFIDMGYRMYLNNQMQVVMQQAARQAGIGEKTELEIDEYLKKQLQPLTNVNNIKINKKSYANFSKVGKPEKITSDTAPVNAYNVGDCYEDSNGNKSYDYDQGRSGVGGADDVLRYEVVITFNRLVPLGGFLGWSNKETVQGNILVKNQPYAAQNGASIVCG